MRLYRSRGYISIIQSVFKIPLVFVAICFAVLWFSPLCSAKESHYFNILKTAEQPSLGNQAEDLSPDPILLELNDGLVSLNVQNADAFQVLKKFSMLSGVQIWVSSDVDEYTITEHFKNRPLDKALECLFKGQSYTFVYDAKDDKPSISMAYMMPSSKTITGKKEDIGMSDDVKSHVLKDALHSNLIPDSIKAALLDQEKSNTPELKNKLDTQRLEAMGTLIDRLEKIGNANPETINKLRQELLLQESLKTKGE